jgi:hypothetical protein
MISLEHPRPQRRHLTRAIGSRLEMMLIAGLLAMLLLPALALLKQTTHAGFGCVRAAFQSTQKACP